MKILVIDTETTGLPENGASIYDKEKWPYIIQLSYILYDFSSNTVSIKDNYVKIDNEIEIPIGSYEKHKLTHEILNEKGLNIVPVLREFNELLYTCDLVIGHNISFDKRMVFVECLRNNLPQYFTRFIGSVKTCKPEYCTMKNTKEYCNIVRLSKTNKTYLKNPSLIELYKKVFPDAIIPADMHNSLVDILITLRCYVKIEHDLDITEKNELIRELFIKYNSL